MKVGGLEREEWKGNKRKNGDMHASMVQVEAQASPVLSKFFKLLWNI